MFKKLFKKKVKDLLDIGDSVTLHTNDHVGLVHKACRICIAKPELKTYEEKLANIEKVMKRGHESVLEHSNIIMLLDLDSSHIIHFAEIPAL
jgi:hypothetical protein